MSRAPDRASVPPRAALAIAHALERDAVRDEGLANWMGDAVEGGDDDAELVHRALGPDLYEGTAGVATFLAAVGAATGEARWVTLAREAVAHALHHADGIAADQRSSLYVGTLGVAHAAALVAHTAGDEALARRARALALDACALRDAPMLDVVAGLASGAPAALHLAGALAAPELADAAHAMARRIADAAIRTPDGCHWDERGCGTAWEPALTGHAHGAAGLGWALLEVGTATGDDRLVGVARDAFRYERRWFRADEGNWPDFRELEDGDDPSEAACALAWCHGAPGIAISRIRGWELLGDATLRDEAHAALATTRRAIATGGDASLCHGRAGLAEVLRMGARLDPSLGAAADAALDQLAREVLAGVDDVPLGVGGGRSPALMTGLAGLGWALVRAALPDWPDVLAVMPRAPGRA